MEIVPWDKFLVETPPGHVREVNDLFSGSAGVVSGSLRISMLLIGSPTCENNQFFDPVKAEYPVKLDQTPRPDDGRVLNYDTLNFRCRTCRMKKAIAIRIAAIHKQGGSIEIEVMKLGEDPQFGERLPGRFMSMIGPDRELFLKGMRCERQAIGIGAYAYYRRVVENQRGRLLDKIKDVALRVKADGDILKRIDDAKTNWKFTESVDSIKDAVPPQLYLEGQNPLVLLHKPLSIGLHGLTDEECLDLAHFVRIVLVKLVDKMESALADETELRTAVANLAKTAAKDKANTQEAKTDSSAESREGK